ncbi:hypothetical protein [Roseomonas indoligenes]|uniref:Uncharacterized protein n=1 Tax=Roseomonas indoligenes TaxID=2820811 RepID=A0A940MTP3_9PROT|nr:hypothetical protein [Pararoseomonas indoligenes]MBP0493938.1 hypothetical protein [Pararoseomonas indoligenes]
MATGMLAIWSDVDPDGETDYLHWLTREHTAERVGIPGFEGVRVFRAGLADLRRYLILYDLSSASVLTSDAYLARLNDPTPWSSRTMPKLRNFARGGGKVVRALGMGQGGHVLALRLPHAVSDDVPLEAIAAEDRVCAVRLLAVDRAGSDVPTNEKALRGGDGSFAALLLIEATDEAALQTVMLEHGEAIAALGAETELPAYSAIFMLRGDAG